MSAVIVIGAVCLLFASVLVGEVRELRLQISAMSSMSSIEEKLNGIKFLQNKLTVEMYDRWRLIANGVLRVEELLTKATAAKRRKR